MKQYTTITEIEEQEDKSPIWALNSSAETLVSSAGELYIGVPKISGSRIDNLSVPQTWLPICLTDQIPRPQLLASTEFRTAVNSGLITLITKEYAASINEQQGADEERARLAEYKRAIADAVRATRLTDEAADAQEEVTSNFTQQFLMFAESLTLKSDTEALNAIRTRAKFTADEVNHILKHSLVDKPNTETFLRSQLNK